MPKHFPNIIISAKESQLVDNAINKLFEEYKDDSEDAILSEGIEKLCTDLGYRPDQFEVLVLAFCLDAEQMCCFTKKEFIHGLKKLNATTLNEIKARLNQKVDKLQNDMELFKQLYRFTFRFGLECGHRILSIDMAIILWRLVYTIHKPDILDRWLSFLENDSNIRGVPKDTWNIFLQFTESFDLASYNPDDAWPSLFDDFVMEYRNEVAKQTNNLNNSSNCSQQADGGGSQDNYNNNNEMNNLNYSSLKRNHQQDDENSRKSNNLNNQVFKL